MKKKAKFVVEIEYDSDMEGLDSEKVKVLKCDTEGDYKGITLALVSGLAFASVKGNSSMSIFEEKLRLLRSTGSALVNMISVLKQQGVLENEVDDSDMDTLADAIKHTINIITYGIAKILGISNEAVEEFNEEYKEAINDQNKNKDGKSDEQKGNGQSSYEDFL